MGHGLLRLQLVMEQLSYITRPSQTAPGLSFGISHQRPQLQRLLDISLKLLMPMLGALQCLHQRSLAALMNSLAATLPSTVLT